MARGRPRKNPGDVFLKSAEMIGWAIGGLEREIASTRERLANLTAQANALRAKIPAGSRGASATAAAPDNAVESSRGGRRKMSAEARRRISEMMTKRWAERRGARGGEGGAAAPGRKRKRRMSAEARKRISDAQKKRWAEHRKAAK
jgi:hypothetical protein